MLFIRVSHIKLPTRVKGKCERLWYNKEHGFRWLREVTPA